MKILKYSMLTFLMITLTACQTLGIPSADTFNKKALVGYATVEAISNTSNTLLTSNKLSKQDASNILQQATVTKIGIDICRTTYQTDPTLGNRRLVATLAILEALKSYVGGVK